MTIPTDRDLRDHGRARSADARVEVHRLRPSPGLICESRSTHLHDQSVPATLEVRAGFLPPVPMCDGCAAYHGIEEAT